MCAPKMKWTEDASQAPSMSQWNMWKRNSLWMNMLFKRNSVSPSPFWIAMLWCFTANWDGVETLLQRKPEASASSMHGTMQEVTRNGQRRKANDAAPAHSSRTSNRVVLVTFGQCSSRRIINHV
ncbi:hypothetical protein AMELA_G00036240 [Ameiurus melas]|uniref:Uncharacterized protein n=1 Tax=Ameiurus melas TaxID=219545 RepID=A0A7J6BAK1_AMEME|nr:hypothetical protein AMELA_G00036240 [Ameiurus melas]